MSFQNAIFKTTPSFKFQGPVTTKSDCLSASYQFDCYKDKDGEVILITPFFDVKAGVKKKNNNQGQNENEDKFYISLINLSNMVIKKEEKEVQNVGDQKEGEKKKNLINLEEVKNEKGNLQNVEDQKEGEENNNVINLEEDKKEKGKLQNVGDQKKGEEKNNVIETKLKGHNSRVTTVRYFQKPNGGDDYFISADKLYKIIVWSLGRNPSQCANIFEVDLKYEGFIYSCLLIFEPDNNNNNNTMYAVTSSIGSNGCTKVIKILPNQETKDINSSNGIMVYYLDYWYNENGDNESKHIIIQGAKNQILFSKYPKNENYHSIKLPDKFPYVQSGLVFKDKYNNDLFVYSVTYGFVEVTDLPSRQSVFKFEFNEDVHLYSFVKWNDDSLLLNDCQNNCIITFDIGNDKDSIKINNKDYPGFKIVSKSTFRDMYFEKFIRKVDLPKYGESLLSIGIDWKIKLFINKGYYEE